MYIFKNAVKNLGRNKGRNIILGIIMVCLLAVASISLSIDSTTNQIKDAYKEQYGSEVFIQPDFERIMAESDPTTINEKTLITDSQYRMMMDSEYLKETEVAYFYGVKSSNTKAVAQQEGDNQGTMSFSADGSSLGGEMPDFNLIAYSDLKYFKDFDEGKRKLISGKMFENDNEALISEDYAKLNDLEIGSKIKLNLANDTTEHEVTIVGIYMDLKQTEGGMMFSSFSDPRNEIIVSEGTVNEFKTEKDNMWAMTSYTFYLKNPEMLDAFNKEVHEKGISEYMNMATDEMAYNQIVKPIEGIAETSMSFLLVFLAFACGLLILLSILSVRERKYEVGVLRAIGMKKSQVMRTLLYESFVTMVICLFLGLGIGALASKPVSAKMLDNQESKTTEMGMVMTIGGPQVEFEAQDVQMSLDSIAKVSLVGVVVALVSTAVGIIYVLRYEPMEILVERD